MSHTSEIAKKAELALVDINGIERVTASFSPTQKAYRIHVAIDDGGVAAGVTGETKGEIKRRVREALAETKVQSVIVQDTAVLIGGRLKPVVDGTVSLRHGTFRV
jgi:hypothetical protein